MTSILDKLFNVKAEVNKETPILGIKYYHSWLPRKAVKIEDYYIITYENGKTRKYSEEHYNSLLKNMVLNNFEPMLVL